MIRRLFLSICLLFSLLSVAEAQLMAPVGSIMAEAKAATDAKDLARAVELYKTAYVNEEPHAAEQLARIYLEGEDGVAADFTAARLWAQKSANAGEARGLLYLGKIWMEGLGVSKDLDKALGYFQQADMVGDMKSARYIGLIALERHENAKAVHWFEKGANAGDITSQYYLGRAYQTGDGIAQDFTTALKWYTTAATRGDLIASDGMVGLASLYEQGQGVPTDLEKAKAFLTKAAVLGNAKAQEELNRISKVQS
ncbi:tetratricopeptide repeat protein [uncultured Cohaesibacter sp.]|uniref:tetratricopeptide repeat protein n=1 Tax=uncultured Cohaesibacter sp. TaxID=1002546 RepID=UPI0029C8A69E|nr:tetratricopeptide repeat protein [uncultured Cohaesibacter sp.]